jgi:intracellular multiplication protein IcmQ
MSNNEMSIEVNRKLIEIFDELLVAGDWEASLFLRAMGKQVRDLREKALQLLVSATGSAAYSTSNVLEEKAGHIKVFISVYQTEGNNLQKWHKTLKSLSDHSISRPVYREETHVQEMIRSKTDKQREAYVKILIKEGDVLATNTKITTDRLGNELIVLKPHTVKLENIIEFVHCQNRYRYLDDQLVLKGEMK